ncbi:MULTISPECIES: metalloregulator ArsR/SmtB family transcription factor [unclassified Isoptericola]|uniref:ArsR/SmtB family transcription factor n=1 Tax=unclassified Isoptericola TaxID=2623355 RepID=UPI002713D367|nr:MULTISPECIES: metalloregulator ArsR/SmtB family transcription factor [unclassified Isoptericola]MDO8144291.1 metalloregulator ArsR/SmtB family transcription factor [Isoptericola sp. 178]MDO8148145.1 metalloregulator ArsR/SmtB family transcription factor [Isoptericola sp. b515]MDO8151622.1 metalloregulator ArsR/SmtB family transcription factor [Isoptericola sp. b408]
MGERRAKDALFTQFAAVGKALGNPGRLELVDLLAQGPRSVEDLAATAGLGTSTCSAHLQTLREAGLVSSRRVGKRVFYALAGDDVAALWAALRQVAQDRRPQTDAARRTYLGPDDTEAVGTAELRRRLAETDTVLLDVRPRAEFDAAHLPGARNIPVEELVGRLAELPRDAEIVACCRGRYCVLAHDAARLLVEQGFEARRAVDGALEWRLAGLLVGT